MSTEHPQQVGPLNPLNTRSTRSLQHCTDNKHPHCHHWIVKSIVERVMLIEGKATVVIARLCEDSVYDGDKIIWEIGIFSGRVSSKISGITYGVIIEVLDGCGQS